MKFSLRLVLQWLLAGSIGVAGLPSTAQTSTAGWQKIDNPPPVIGADRKRHSATCSGYPGTDAKFSF